MFTLIARLILGMALLGIWLSASVMPSYACSCAPLPSQSESFAYATEVFRGKVMYVTVRNREAGVWRSTDPVTVEFEVSEVWKGPRRPIMTLKTARSGESCGFGFKIGAEYIVYSRHLSVNLCDRTYQIGASDYDDREALGRGNLPVAPTATTTPAPTAVAEIPATGGGCGRASSSGADVWWAALAVGVAWLGKRGSRPRR